MSALTLIRKAPNAASVYLLLTAYLESAGKQLPEDYATLFQLPVRNATDIAAQKQRMSGCLQNTVMNRVQAAVLQDAGEMLEAALVQLRVINSAIEQHPAMATVAACPLADSGPGVISPPRQHAQDH